ncbi:MAG: indolepyruvate oxidoreductase subunit beta [Firmicutes bacterium]|jgi:indolepyruvate ferredoxin oxidoreductase beta subunit|nr:indolepyruvate oxidoreductase subunit beta [Bacillota bacterium]
MKKVDILMAGVGGQGTILASNILSEVGLELGYDVKKAEVHGMAQRGGTVESHVRWGEKVYSPVIEQGEVDILLGFEMLESGRWSAYLKKDAVIIINRYRIPPPAVNLGKARYPSEEEIESTLKSGSQNILWINATEIAKELGNPAMVGVVLLGVLSKHLGGAEDVWLGVIKRMVPPKFQELNTKAFLAGRQI